jgi:hypothetical protein
MAAASWVMVVWGSAVAGAQPPPGPEPSIALPPALARVLTDYETAWRNRDAAGLARLFADNRIVVPTPVLP